MTKSISLLMNLIHSSALEMMKRELMMNVESIIHVTNLILLRIFQNPSNISQDFTASGVVIFVLLCLEKLVSFLHQLHHHNVVVFSFVSLQSPSLRLNEIN